MCVHQSKPNTDSNVLLDFLDPCVHKPNVSKSPLVKNDNIGVYSSVHIFLVAIMALRNIWVHRGSPSEAVSAELDLGDALEWGRLLQPQPEAVADVGKLDEGGWDLWGDVSP